MKLLRLFAVFVLLAAPAACFAEESARNYGPWNRNLLAFESQDGIHFKMQGLFIPRGGVPNLTEAADGNLYAVFQWFPQDPSKFDRIAFKRSSDKGKSWSEPQIITIENQPKEYFRAFDPTLAALPDGSLRLYFTAERISEKTPRGNRAIFSAISQDGTRFEFEPGQRFGFESVETYDSSVVFFKGRWHMYCPTSEDGRAFHAVSEDGLNFKLMKEVQVPLKNGANWIGNATADANEIRFYGSAPGGWSAVSKDGDKWTLVNGLDLPGADPAVIKTGEGKFLAIVTGGLRSDAQPGYPAWMQPARKPAAQKRKTNG